MTTPAAVTASRPPPFQVVRMNSRITMLIAIPLSEVHVEVAEDSFGLDGDLILTRWGFGPVGVSGPCGECGECRECDYSNDQD
jgi:hypothetical protein